MDKVTLNEKDWSKQVVFGDRYIIRVFPKEVTDVSGNISVESVEEVIDHKPTKADFAALEERWANASRRWKKTEVADYAKTDAVKEFTISATAGWLDSEARVSISKAVSDKAAAGRELVTIYLGENGFEMTPAKAQEILSAVEVYASDCFDITERHILAIDQLSTIEDIEGYDYKSNYPSKLVFSI